MARTEKGALGALTGSSLGDAGHVAPGMPAGSATDDSEQALIVAELIIEGKTHRAQRVRQAPSDLGGRHEVARIARLARALDETGPGTGSPRGRHHDHGKDRHC